MKKHLIAVLLVVAMFLAVLSGCSLIKGLEHDVQVILINDGNYVGTYTVNQFNNAIVPEVEKPVGEGDNPEYYQDGTPMYDEDGNAINYTFMGWSVLENWTEEDGEEYLAESPILIRYDDIKDFVEGKKLSITLYAAYVEVEPSDLVIAWYNRETTSGLNQAYMDAFEANLYSYLESQGYDTASMDIVIRSYSGDVGSSCSQIIRDGDVDIMVGWSSTSNITSTGGMTEGVDFLVNNSGVTIGSTSRYAALLTNTELSRLVYLWIFEEYADGKTVELPSLDGDTGTTDEETGDTEVTEPENPDLVIAWYSKSETSGLTQDLMTAFSEALTQYLSTTEYSEAVVVLRAYDGNVGPSCSAIMADGDVDIMVGWSSTSNITGTGGMTEGEDFIENNSGVTIGTAERYAARLTDTELCNLVYNWILEEYGDGSYGDRTQSGTTDEETGDTDVTDEETLANNGVTYINIKSGLTMGEKSSCYVYQLTDSEIYAYMSSWLISEDAIPLYIGTAASTTVALAA